MFTATIPRATVSNRLHVLCCITCGDAKQVTLRELLRFMRTDWPHCCGREMMLLSEIDKPQIDRSY
jgi:hypothetical protein